MSVPIRTCITCRRRAPKRTLQRLVVLGDAVQTDPSGASPGRGAYLCGSAACTDAALRRDGAAIRRALRLSNRSVTLDGDALRDQTSRTGDGSSERSHRPPPARRETSAAARRRKGVSA